MKRLLLALTMLCLFALPIRNAQADTLIGCGIGFIGVISAKLIGLAVDPNVIVIK